MTDLSSDAQELQARLGKVQAHARLLGRLLSELPSCPTRDIALTLAAEAIKDELGLNFTSCWSTVGGKIGVIGQGIDASVWIEGGLGGQGLVQQVAEKEEIVIARPEEGPKDCPVIGAGLITDSVEVLAIPVEGREVIVEVVAVIAFGLPYNTDDEERENFEVLGRMMSATIQHLDSANAAMEAAVSSEAQVALFDQVTLASDADDMVKRALDIVRAKFGWGYASFWRLDPSSNHLVFELESGDIGDEFSKVTKATSFERGQGLCGKAWELGELIFVHELSELGEDARLGLAKTLDLHSALCVPVVVDDETIGTLEFLTQESIYLSTARRAALDSVRMLIGQAYRRARELDRQTLAAEQARGLAEMIDALHEVTGVNEAGERVLEIMLQRFGVRWGSAWAVVDNQPHLISILGDCTPEDKDAIAGDVSSDGWLMSSIRGQEVTQTYEIPACDKALALVMSRLKYTVHFAIPVVVAGQTQVLLTLHRCAASSSSDGDLTAMRSVADLVSRAIRRIEADKKIRRYEPMVEETPTAIALCDPSGQFVYLNQAAGNFVDRLESVIGFNRTSIIGQPANALLKRQLTEGQNILDPQTLPIRGRIPLGDDIVAVTVSALINGGGEFLGPMLSIELVTEEVAREKALQLSQEKERKQQEELRLGVAVLLDVVSRVEQGDLTCQVPDCGAGEIAKVAGGLRRLLQKLRDSMQVIGAIANQLDKHAEKLNTVAERVAGNAKSTLENVSHASEGVGSATGGLRSAAEEADALSVSVASVASHASEAAQVGGSAMGVASDAAKKIARLGQSSQQIGVVMRTINTIAEQTKLLALNATIESARAGEAGRGFAVVANEVKNLARETGDATQDIAHRIEAIQGDTNEVVAAIGRIREVIESVNELQTQIVSAVEEQSVTTKTMTGSTGTAVATLADVSVHTSGVVGMAEDTVSAATQARSAALNLRETSDRLAQTLVSFRY